MCRINLRRITVNAVNAGFAKLFKDMFDIVQNFFENHREIM